MKIFNCIMEIGEQMLISGAEVHRVEDSINRMCYSYGAKRVDVFIITSSMVVSCYTEDGKTLTQTRRITSSKINIERVHYLNDLSRRICQEKLSVEEIEKELKKVGSMPRFPLWLEGISSALIAGSFTLFFGGSFLESVVSLCIGALVWLGIFFTDKIIPQKIFSKFFACMMATLLSFLSLRFGWIDSVDQVITGNIMTLIPGIGLTNAIRDLFVGDSIAGILRLIDAILTALAIAAGYYLVAVLRGVIL